MCVSACVKINNYYRTKEDTLPVCFYETQAQVDSFYKHEKIHKMKTVDWISTNLVKDERAFFTFYVHTTHQY